MTDKIDMPTSGALPEMVIHADDKDWFLQSIIRLADAGIELGVTLTVAGSVISGTLISGRSYFNELGELVKTATGGNTNEDSKVLNNIAAAWQSNSKLYDIPEGVGNDYVRPAPGYIHLRSAFIFAPNGSRLPSGDNGTLWRGRLATISGFTVGAISIS